MLNITVKAIKEIKIGDNIYQVSEKLSDNKFLKLARVKNSDYIEIETSEKHMEDFIDALKINNNKLSFLFEEESNYSKKYRVNKENKHKIEKTKSGIPICYLSLELVDESIN